MLKHQPMKFWFVSLAIVAQACTPSTTQASEAKDPITGAQQTLAAATQQSVDPVAGAQQTLAAATQQSLTALAFAQATIVAANPSASGNPFFIPITGFALPNDPNIEAHFTGQAVCSYFEINLTNRSTTTFKSMSMSISAKDDPSSMTVTSSTNGFLGHDPSQTNTVDNCQSPSLSSNLGPGASYSLFFPKFTAKEGSTFEGAIMLCTEQDLAGQCSKNSIVFTPIAEIIPSPAPTLSSLATNAENIPSPASTPIQPDIFKAEFVNVVNPCPETWWVRIILTNNFNRPLKSMSISVKDTVTGKIAPNPDNPDVFTDQDPSLCHPNEQFGDPKGIPNLEQNTSFTVSSGILPKDPTGDLVEATLKLCTEEGLTGQCSEKTISFTPGITAQPTVDTTKPTFPYIILSAGTYCRTGPGKEYDNIGAYAADTKIPVLGKDSSGSYWVVASPYKNDNNPKCWLDGSYVKESGNLTNVAIYPVPPTPTPTPKPPTATPTPTETSTLTPTPTP